MTKPIISALIDTYNQGQFIEQAIESVLAQGLSESELEILVVDDGSTDNTASLDAGGMPEFVEDNCGFVVPYLDITTMADRILRLLNYADCRAKMGAAARRKVAERHDVSVAAPRILEIIEKTIHNATR